jgi:hypothetical protein
LCQHEVYKNQINSNELNEPKSTTIKSKFVMLNSEKKYNKQVEILNVMMTVLVTAYMQGFDLQCSNCLTVDGPLISTGCITPHCAVTTDEFFLVTHVLATELYTTHSHLYILKYGTHMQSSMLTDNMCNQETVIVLRVLLWWERKAG